MNDHAGDPQAIEPAGREAPAAGAAGFALAGSAAAALAGCGGSGGEAAARPVPTETTTTAQAARFLQQASFGANDASVNEVVARGIGGWIEWQFGLPQSLHRAHMEAVIDPAVGQGRFRDNLLDSFWKQAITGADQLRQRVVFALSEIFVVSQVNGAVGDRPRGHADYLDMLGRNAFGNFRQLLEAVSLHPIMGLYLSHLRNQKESPTTGRVPDENYAREVMQLFTIGLVQLNDDGSEKRDAGGHGLPTYGNEDISGLARVFTGWSWAGPDNSNARFFGNSSASDPDRDVLPMQPYPQYHSTAEKRFLGVTIPAGADARAGLKVALDTLFNHPNTPPFIGRQLIQRLVTSNPSPGYVGRVAAAFRDNGRGVRGDMKAVLRAILLDGEARAAASAEDPRFGKLREPVLRLAAWARAFDATSASGEYRIRSTSNASSQLGQSPLRAESVFNFFRPGFVPANTQIADAGLVAPEFQITGETSVAGYINFMRNVVNNGVGQSTDVRSGYAAEIALAGDTAALLDRVDLLLTGRRLRAASRAAIRAAIEAITPTAANANANRAKLAVFLTMVAPEFLVQT